MVELLRKTSDMPAIKNSDDARVFRYAFNGRNGIVKGFCEDLSLSYANDKIKIGSGEFIIDGWQGRVSADGQVLNCVASSSPLYYKIIAEIDLRVASDQTARIVISYSATEESSPIVEKGDDLTHNVSGQARMLLYYLKIENGNVTILATAHKLDFGYAMQKTVDDQFRAFKAATQETLKDIQTLLNSLVPRVMWQSSDGKSSVLLSELNHQFVRNKMYEFYFKFDGNSTGIIKAKYTEGGSFIVTNCVPAKDTNGMPARFSLTMFSIETYSDHLEFERCIYFFGVPNPNIDSIAITPFEPVMCQKIIELNAEVI